VRPKRIVKGLRAYIIRLKALIINSNIPRDLEDIYTIKDYINKYYNIRMK